jgi:hypothetical protein
LINLYFTPQDICIEINGKYKIETTYIHTSPTNHWQSASSLAQATFVGVLNDGIILLATLLHKVSKIRQNSLVDAMWMP